MDRRFDDVNQWIDGVTHILTLLAGRSHDHEQRIEKLEGGKEQLHRWSGYCGRAVDQT